MASYRATVRCISIKARIRKRSLPLRTRFICYLQRAGAGQGGNQVCCLRGERAEADRGSITVKTVSTAGRFFRALGYKHVEDGLVKVLD